METKKIVIKGAFADTVRNILDHKKHTNKKYLPEYMQIKEVFKETGDCKKELIKLFQTCINYKIKNDFLIFTIPRPEDEKNKWIEGQKTSLKYSLLRLKKWFNLNDENKQQITIYLKHKKLDWILTEINS